MNTDLDMYVQGSGVELDETYDGSIGGRVGGVASGSNWNADEREALKRMVLQYGVPGRWHKIREMSNLGDKTLAKASDVEMRSYTVSFLTMLNDALAKNDCKKIDAIELADLRKYISNLIL